MHAITNKEQLKHGPFEISDYPDRLPDSTIAFSMCKAVPEIIDEVQDTAKLGVQFGSIKLENGMHLSPDELIDEPEISIGGPTGTYTLMMIDADPTRASYKSWLHWLIINIPSNDVVRGEVVTDYMPPEPDNKEHRYMFLLFKQNGRVQCKAPAKRQGFQVKEFAKQHDLGSPVGSAANGLFFWSAADEL